MKRRTILILAVLVALAGIALFARSWWRERYFHLTASGSLGCGIGTVHLDHNGEIHELRTGLDTVRLLGRNLTSDEVVMKFRRRISKIPEDLTISNVSWTREPLKREDYELKLAADLLLEIKHPESYDIFTKMIRDPKLGGFSFQCLVRLGDRRACPLFLEMWDTRNDSGWMYTKAFRSLPYNPAAPNVIEMFRPHIGDYDRDALLKTLESISGDDLSQFRSPSLRTPKATEQFKAELREWWNTRGKTVANKRLHDNP